MLARFREFLTEVRLELKRVSWTTWDELVSSTWLVIVSTVLLTVFILVADLVLGQVLSLVL